MTHQWAGEPQNVNLVSGVDGYGNPVDLSSLPVVDQGLSFIAGGTTSCSSATQVATGQTGSGYLTIVNLDASNTIYVGLTGVTSSTGLPIPAGASDTVCYANVALIFAIGSTTVGWCVRR